jgi:hypothetical protein
MLERAGLYRQRRFEMNLLTHSHRGNSADADAAAERETPAAE